MSKKRSYEVLEPEEFSPEQMVAIEAQIAQAEADLQTDEVRINFRWQKNQLDLIKRAADQIGIPYQTYMKDVLFRQAVEDVKAFQSLTNGLK
ncbi:MAG: hypothetical protein IV090_18465 [Candidatus Sericytochromatia bacterium]|nr:hypothetical protein [Candidatus Sericytochromatia bacterium]